MGNVVKLTAYQDTPQKLLTELAADSEIEAVCVVAFMRNGDSMPVHSRAKRRDMAFASVLFGYHSVED